MSRVSRRSPERPASQQADERWLDVPRVEWVDHASTDGMDAVVREEPLEIRLAGVAIAVVMRTPGHDEDLVWGFLVSEGIAGPSDIASVRPCDTVVDPRSEGNVMLVTPKAHADLDIARFRRNLYSTSSCGICGKASIEQALATAPPVSDASTFSPSLLYRLPIELGNAQPAFARTGGLHAAALFDATATVVAAREDVGRHNAVDKVIGTCVQNSDTQHNGRILMVSGRVSFEIVQKAVAAGISTVAAISAPSALAIHLANEANVTLIGFLRGQRMCVYAGSHRIRSSADND